jgi:hypothetical protein
MWKINEQHFPYILLISFVAFFILGIALGFTPAH